MKSRYFIILAILAAIFGFFQLSSNAHQAARLRDKILAKDQSGSDVSADIQALEQFSHNHINANIQFELTASYQRALAASQPPVPSGALYAQAQAACAGRADSITQAHCVTDYVSKRLPPAPQPVAPPSEASFVRQFHSPIWTQDSAGLAFLASVLLLLVAGALRFLRPKAYI